MDSDVAVSTLAIQLDQIDFHHPYTPYDVQQKFMQTVYSVLDSGDGQVGILESPTGTVSFKPFPAPRGVDAFKLTGSTRVSPFLSSAPLLRGFAITSRRALMPRWKQLQSRSKTSLNG